MKKSSIIVAALCLLLAATTAWAANSGETMFKKECGACHMKGGQAFPVNPGEKAGSVWVKYFLRGRHPVELKISEADMGVILQYLESHAADSDRPEMLVIPK